MGLFSSLYPPKEHEEMGFDSYSEYWLYSKPSKEDYTSPIFPGGFDQQGYEEDYYDWIRKKPQSGSWFGGY